MLAVAILAAGKGTRMKSKLPKVLQQLGGISLVERVIASCKEVKPDRTFLIIGHESEQVKEKLRDNSKIEFIKQVPQNGTGHAIQQLLPVLQDFEGDLLVLNGDVPLLRKETIKRLVDQHRASKAGVTFLSARMDNPRGYGRVFADKNGKVKLIIEDCDCNEEQKTNKLTNAGIYCFNWSQLKEYLPSLSAKNEQKELYLTDTVSMFIKAMHSEVDNTEEVSGINDRQQMAYCESILQERLRTYWMKNGVTFIDKDSCTLSESCQFGTDVVIEPQTHMRGKCHIGDGCIVGPGSLIQNAELGKNVTVLHSVISDSKVGDHVQIGPYAHVRPQSILADKCKIGNFVEVKKSVLGEGTKINHLSYIGDADVGGEVNVGAGTITANYDGKNKHRTIIGNNSRTGANSVLVAPIVIGKGVTIGAGSTLTKDVPNDALAIARAKQLTIEKWRKKQ